jgi:CheY-like chemotaxis protein
MTSAQDTPATNHTGLHQLRHDLLNPLNVLVGATGAILQSELNPAQRGWVQMVQSATKKLMDIVDRIELYQDNTMMDGRARLADLCSIAAARVGKPFDRQRLVDAIQQVGGPGPLRILLVDDSPELAVLVRTYVKGTDWDVDVVDNGERAVSQSMTEQYDVVLMDIDLPGIDGAAAAHAIRAADLARGAKPTPIIAMTAFDPMTSADTLGDDRDADAQEESDVVRIDDPEIAPLVPEFLENRRAEITWYREALQARDFARIQSSAHKMKGTGRGYGFSAISRIGAELELAAHQQDEARMAQLIDELEQYLARVTIAT